MADAESLKTSDIKKDIENHQLNMLQIMIDKLENELIARLSELAEQKIGRLTFYFVQEKLHKFDQEVKEFHRFIKKKRFHEKRNYNISHKVLPEKWTEHNNIHIPYKTILKGIMLALRLMKKIDAESLGPSSKYLWREMRKRRYSPMVPVKVSYLLLPYLNLSEEDRKKIIIEEMHEGNIIWESVKAKVNGEEKIVIICKKWGAILIEPGRALVLDKYPLQELHKINFGPKEIFSASNSP